METGVLPAFVTPNLNQREWKRRCLGYDAVSFQVLVYRYHPVWCCGAKIFICYNGGYRVPVSIHPSEIHGITIFSIGICMFPRQTTVLTDTFGTILEFDNRIHRCGRPWKNRAAPRFQDLRRRHSQDAHIRIPITEFPSWCPTYTPTINGDIHCD
jgi:hypothetical protein